ncbi:MAG: hypothetical protein ACTSSC_03950 [Promethearchaeota archaeon]
MAVELAEEEELVLNIVQEYLNKNRQFMFEEIMPFLNSRIRLSSANISKEGVRKILISLTNKKLIVEGSKLFKSEILENQKRKNIYEFIAKNPGTYFNRILHELNFSNHIVVWHLSMLLKFDFIRKDKLENHEIYFGAKKEFQEVILSYFKSKEKSKKILNYIKDNNIGITKTHLSQKLDMHINTVEKYLSLLIKYKMLVKKRIDNKNLFFLSEA